jgi:hypothetical protein
MKFLILFDNTNLLFFPGQFLSGRVLLELQEDTPALGRKSKLEFNASEVIAVTRKRFSWSH